MREQPGRAARAHRAEPREYKKAEYRHTSDLTKLPTHAQLMSLGEGGAALVELLLEAGELLRPTCGSTTPCTPCGRKANVRTKIAIIARVDDRSLRGDG